MVGRQDPADEAAEAGRGRGPHVKEDCGPGHRHRGRILPELPALPPAEPDQAGLCQLHQG